MTLGLPNSTPHAWLIWIKSTQQRSLLPLSLAILPFDWFLNHMDLDRGSWRPLRKLQMCSFLSFPLGLAIGPPGASFERWQRAAQRSSCCQWRWCVKQPPLYLSKMSMTEEETSQEPEGRVLSATLLQHLVLLNGLCFVLSPRFDYKLPFYTCRKHIKSSYMGVFNGIRSTGCFWNCFTAIPPAAAISGVFILTLTFLPLLSCEHVQYHPHWKL